MQNRFTYEFAIIRIVPKVEREEFFNVGVILFSKHKKYLNIKYHIDAQKLKTFTEKLDLDYLNNYLKAWDLICKGSPEGGVISKLDLPSRFRWLTASRSTIIQNSKIHPGLCDAPQKELDDLFIRFVL